MVNLINSLGKFHSPRITPPLPICFLYLNCYVVDNIYDADNANHCNRKSITEFQVFLALGSDRSE